MNYLLMENTLIIIQNISYVFLKTFFYTFLILFIFKIFKIKDSQSFIFLMILAMIKPFSSSLKLGYSSDFFSDNEVHYFFVEKIKNIFHPDVAGDRELYTIGMVFVCIFLAIIVIGTIFIIYQNSYNLRKLMYSPNLSRCVDKEINLLVKKYSGIMKINTPEIYFAHGSNFGFFTIGLIKNIIILNTEIFDFLNADERETIILHELSHIKRKDNILNILLYYFNLINFYNPISYLIHSFVKAEQEKDCDRMVLKYSDKTNKELAENILTSLIKIRNLSYGFKFRCPKAASFFSISGTISEMRIKLRIKSLISMQKNETGLSLSVKIPLYIIFIALLFY